MANYHSSYTGQEIDAAVGKTSQLPASAGTSGQIPRLNSQGVLVYESPGSVAENDTGLVTGGAVFSYIAGLDADNTEY